MKQFKSIKAGKLLPILLLFLVLGVAAFFRFWQLDKIPPGIYPDEAMNGMDALQANATGHYQIFYPNNNGREGLWINMIALVLKFAPPTGWSLRLLSAIFGTLTVLGVYLLTKEIFTKDKPQKSNNGKYISPEQCLALSTAFLLAVSFWHVNFSRIAFRAILTPFLLVYSFYFLWHYFHRSKLWSLILSGIFFGLGFHTYIAFRVAPALLLVAWLPYLAQRWPRNTPRRVPTKNDYFVLSPKAWHLFIYLLTIIALIAPIGVYFLKHPDYFMGRASDVALWRSATPLKDLAWGTIKTLGMFHVRGDYNWRHNFSGRPQLLWPVGIFFLIGLAYTVRSLWRHQKNKPNLITLKPSLAIFLLAWFVLFLMPAILTVESLPHALRALGVVPVVYIFAGLGLILPFFWAQNRLQKYRVWFQKTKIIKLSRQVNRIQLGLKILFMLILIALGVYQYNKYFIAWARRPEVAAAFSQDFVAIAEYLNFYQKQNIKRFVIVNQDGVLVDGIPMPSQTVKFVTYGQGEITYLLPDQIGQIQIDQTKKVNALIVLMRDDKSIVKQIQEKYPQNISGTYFEQFRFISI